MYWWKKYLIKLEGEGEADGDFISSRYIDRIDHSFLLFGAAIRNLHKPCTGYVLFVGVVLGDIPTALTFGALAELAYMGFGVGAGGTVPPNPVGPGIVGTIMAITLKHQG